MLIVTLLPITVIFAQSQDKVSIFQKNTENESFSLKPYATYNFNSYFSDFNQFQGVIDCNKFTKGQGNSLNFGIELETRLSEDILLSLNFAYNDKSALFQRNNDAYIRNLSTNLEEKIITSAEINSKLTYIDFKPGLKFNLVEFWAGPMFLTPALRLSYSLGGSFNQVEKISSPSTAVFTEPNGTNTSIRYLADGNFSTLNQFNFGGNLSLEKYFQISSSNYLSLIVSYDYAINNILQDANWKTGALSVGLGYRYSIDKGKDEPIVIPPPLPKPPKEEPIVVETPKAVAPPDFDLSLSYDFTMSEVTSGKEILATIPIVNSVFFDDGKSTISGKYETTYSENNYFTGNAIEKHYYILSRIAKRLRENPNGKLLLKGYTSGKLTPEENKKLAQERVANIKNIMIEMGIDTKRIFTETPTEPDIKSSLENIDLAVENRRVDLILQNVPLQTYVEITSYKEVVGGMKVEAKVFNSTEKVRVQANMSKNIYNVGNNEKLEIFYKHRVDVHSDTMQINTVANLNEKYKTYSEVVKLKNLKSNLVNLNLENFEAVLRFEYNSSEISNENKELINQLYNLVPENTTLVILGSTDTYGTDKRNKTLAAERATATEAYIKMLKGRKIKIETTTTNEKFDESEPQGRFLNRSIRLRLKP